MACRARAIFFWNATTFLNGIIGRPILLFAFSDGNNSLIHPIIHQEYF